MPPSAPRWPPNGLTVIPPYDHPHVIAGQGTAALELLEETGELDMLVVPVGGGGLMAGHVLDVPGRVGVIISVGNVDTQRFAELCQGQRFQ